MGLCRRLVGVDFALLEVGLASSSEVLVDANERRTDSIVVDDTSNDPGQSNAVLAPGGKEGARTSPRSARREKNRCRVQGALFQLHHPLSNLERHSRSHPLLSLLFPLLHLHNPPSADGTPAGGNTSLGASLVRGVLFDLRRFLPDNRYRRCVSAGVELL